MGCWSVGGSLTCTQLFFLGGSLKKTILEINYDNQVRLNHRTRDVWMLVKQGTCDAGKVSLPLTAEASCSIYIQTPLMLKSNK